MSSLFESTKNTRAIINGSYRYIRSDVPVFLSEKEIKWLTDNNITTIVDLREESEQNRKPCILKNNKSFDYKSMPVTGGNAVPKSTGEVAFSYINMADEKMNNIIDTIMNAETNVLYFCNAGKDRTGAVTAIILSRLGYDRKYIIEDYLLSGENFENELKLYAENNPEIDIDVITPRAEYIEKFLDYIELA
ncbi:MAG: tyrosine-protein phosphatase [Ruminococcus sp.]|nr:tyrosine-protein phosphatase [Ruminococcus sp.]